jgi:pimeloyl-ACP methyl ester carboxylesterase
VRLIVFNPRGTGLSDRPRSVTLEARMDDITAILDTLGVDRATIFGVS